MIRCCITAGVLVWQLIPAVIAAPVPPEPVSPTPGADARRAARVAYELGQRSEALPAPAPNGWLRKVRLPENLEITRLPNPTDNGEYVCVSNHYLITAPVQLDDDALRNVIYLFESAYTVSQAIAAHMPVVRMLREPKKILKMHVRLVPTQEEYLRRGGVPGSAGVYQRSRIVDPASRVPVEDQPINEDTIKRDTILVAFPAVGITPEGKQGEAPFNAHLLIHEATHQCFSFNNLPIWSNEGWAEYVGASPHVDGEVDFAQGFANISARARRSADSGRLDCAFSLQDFFTMGPESMYSLGLNPRQSTDTYALSAMLVAFFLHMDGERGVAAMRDYMQARVDGEAHPEALHRLTAPYGGTAALQELFCSSWRARGVRLQMHQSH